MAPPCFLKMNERSFKKVSFSIDFLFRLCYNRRLWCANFAKYRINNRFAMYVIRRCFEVQDNTMA